MRLLAGSNASRLLVSCEVGTLIAAFQGKNFSPRQLVWVLMHVVVNLNVALLGAAAVTAWLYKISDSHFVMGSQRCNSQ